MRTVWCLLLLMAVSCDDERACLYDDEVVEYYIDIACHYENTDDLFPVRKWKDDLIIRVFGDATEEDISEVMKVTGELNSIQQELSISVTEESNYNVGIYFIPREKFDSILYQSAGATGIASYNVNFDSEIQEATICIASNENHVPTRMHAIREELTQILGLPNDINSYPNSIFWQGGGYIATEYLEIDKLVIQMHYSDVIKPGMTADEVAKLVCWK